MGKIFKPKLLLSNLRTKECYSELYDKITNEEAERHEEFVKKIGFNPSKERLEQLRAVLQKNHKKEFPEEEVRGAFQSLFTFGSFAMSAAVKEYRTKRKEKRIKEWIKEAKTKDKRILSIKPFENIKCPKCGKLMDYKWSDLNESGTVKNPQTKVILFYNCSDGCERRIIFEDGAPWVSKEKDLCVICKGKRKSIVTSDNQNNKFIVYECLSCGSKQVENF